jgi:hypothetical protein
MNVIDDNIADLRQVFGCGGADMDHSNNIKVFTVIVVSVEDVGFGTKYSKSFVSCGEWEASRPALTLPVIKSVSHSESFSLDYLIF